MYDTSKYISRTYKLIKFPDNLPYAAAQLSTNVTSLIRNLTLNLNHRDAFRPMVTEFRQ